MYNSNGDETNLDDIDLEIVQRYEVSDLYQ